MRFSIPTPASGFVTLALLALLGGRAGGAPAASAAPTPPLTPDRPGFTNGSDTVLPGRVQVEAGGAVTRDPAADGGAATTDFPNLLARFGLTPTLELRVQLPDYSLTNRGGPSGFGDAQIGAKVKVYQSKDGNTKLSLTPAVSVPTGARALTSGHVDPLLTLGAQTTSGARWNLAANIELSDPSGGGTRDFTTAPSASVTYQLTPMLSVYGELYDSLPRQGPPSPIADGGFTFLVSPNLQLDIETGYGLGGDAPVRFFSGGVAVRF